MSYGYSIYFTTKDGKFMGQWVIQNHLTRDKIEELKIVHLFDKEYYGYSGYIIFEINLSIDLDIIDIIDDDIYTGIRHARNEKLRMFLG